MEAQSIGILMFIVLVMAAVGVFVVCIWKIVKLFAMYKMETRIEELEALSKNQTGVSIGSDGTPDIETILSLISPKEARTLRRLSFLAGYPRMKRTSRSASSVRSSISTNNNPFRMFTSPAPLRKFSSLSAKFYSNVGGSAKHNHKIARNPRGSISNSTNAIHGLSPPPSHHHHHHHFQSNRPTSTPPLSESPIQQHVKAHIHNPNCAIHGSTPQVIHFNPTTPIHHQHSYQGSSSNALNESTRTGGPPTGTNESSRFQRWSTSDLESASYGASQTEPSGLIESVGDLPNASTNSPRRCFRPVIYPRPAKRDVGSNTEESGLNSVLLSGISHTTYPPICPYQILMMTRRRSSTPPTTDNSASPTTLRMCPPPPPSHGPTRGINTPPPPIISSSSGTLRRSGGSANNHSCCNNDSSLYSTVGNCKFYDSKKESLIDIEPDNYEDDLLEEDEDDNQRDDENKKDSGPNIK